MASAKRRFFLLTAMLFGGIIIFMTLGCAKEKQPEGPKYPTRPVELLVPFAAGGSHDLNGRAVVAAVQKYLGQPMTITLRPGASGVIGTAEVANAPKDGYKLLFAGLGPNTALPLAQEVPYDADSFVPIAMVNYTPVVLVVPGNSPYNTVKELIDGINANPGKLNYATSGAYGNNHIPQAMIWDAFGVLGKITPVHFDGGGPQVTAVLAGQVDVATVFHSQIIDHTKAGNVKVLAVTDYERIPADEADGVFKDVPTFVELGYPDIVLRIWRAIMAPSGIPKDVELFLRDVFEKLGKDPEFRELLGRLGERGDQHMDGPEFKEQWDRERAVIEPVIRMIKEMED